MVSRLTFLGGRLPPRLDSSEERSEVTPLDTIHGMKALKDDRRNEFAP